MISFQSDCYIVFGLDDKSLQQYRCIDVNSDIINCQYIHLYFM